MLYKNIEPEIKNVQPLITSKLLVMLFSKSCLFNRVNDVAHIKTEPNSEEAIRIELYILIMLLLYF